MKTSVLQKFVVSGLLISGAFTAAAVDVERVQFADGKLLIWQNGAVFWTTNEVFLPFGIVVKTNGTFTVKGGRERPLAPGDLLGRDGMLLKPDGTIMPVMDHVTSNQGRVIAMKDGEATEVSGVAGTADGTTMRADRKITLPNGDSRWLLDGELFYADGGKLPAQDTISMRNGQVYVQKDGSTLAIGPTRSIMMNDGTKVLGDGALIFFNGERSKLVEGQTWLIEGVRRR